MTINTTRLCECGELKDRDMEKCDKCFRIEAMMRWGKFTKKRLKKVTIPS